jgi:hypothetical protein
VDIVDIDLRGMGCGGMDWTYLPQDRNQWRAVVNKIMNARVPKMMGNS